MKGLMTNKYAVELDGAWGYAWHSPYPARIRITLNSF